VFGNGQYMHVKKGHLDTTTEARLIEETLKDYIEKREAIDHATEKERYLWVRAHTDPRWFKPWFEFMSPTNPKSPVEEYRQAEKAREVHVYSLVRSSTTHEFVAEATFIDRRFGKEIGRGDWVVILKAQREDIEGAAEVAALNPLGLIVSNYDSRARTIADADKARGAAK
jgi:type IV secretory pathway component VirB8